ncbi:MAG: hypothetical protein R3D67_06375 [Hyphomicrobiaceae bacterium]
MASEIDGLMDRLNDLGQRIEKKLDELSAEGISHANERQTALDMQMKHARLEALAKARREASEHPERDAAIASEAEVTILSIEQWLAGIDKGY